jgi:hypothetical protein
MFDLSVDERLSAWAELRARVETCKNPLEDVWEFWCSCPFIPHNHKIDPYYQRSWPTPWEIIVDNRYDDFTKSLMIGNSLKFTERFANSKIDLRILVDKPNNRQYNIVCVEDNVVINYNDNGPELLKNVPDSFLLENIMELNVPR